MTEDIEKPDPGSRVTNRLPLTEGVSQDIYDLSSQKFSLSEYDGHVCQEEMLWHVFPNVLARACGISDLEEIQKHLSQSYVALYLDSDWENGRHIRSYVTIITDSEFLKPFIGLIVPSHFLTELERLAPDTFNYLTDYYFPTTRRSMGTFVIDFPALIDGLKMREAIFEIIRTRWSEIEDREQGCLRYHIIPRGSCRLSQRWPGLEQEVLVLASVKTKKNIAQCVGVHEVNVGHDIAESALNFACGDIINSGLLPSLLDQEVLSILQRMREQDQLVLASAAELGIGSMSWPGPKEFADKAGILDLFIDFVSDYMADEDCPAVLVTARQQDPSHYALTRKDLMRLA